MKKWLPAAVLAVLATIVAAVIKMRNSFSVGIIGGADGPTAIFVSGPAANTVTAALGVLAAVLAIAAAYLWLRKRKK